MKNNLFWLGCATAIVGSIAGQIISDNIFTDGHVVTEDKQGLEVRPTEGAVKYKVTAYCPCEKCCGRWSDGFFADNTSAVGLAVAAPERFKFGTMIDIPGYGLVPVRDRGGAIQGDRLDVFFLTHQEALNWGVKILECKIGETK